MIKTINVDDNVMSTEILSFIQEAEKCVKLYAKKNHDYGNSFDKGMKEIGFMYGVGRIYDKCSRLVNLSNGKDAMCKGETIQDTLQDLACYSLMTLSFITRAFSAVTPECKEQYDSKKDNSCGELS